MEQDGKAEDESKHINYFEDAPLLEQYARRKEKVVEGNIPLQEIPRPRPIFHQRLKNKAEDGKFENIVTTLKQLSVNIPLVRALENMSGYAKSMKYFVTMNRIVSLDLSNDVPHKSVIYTTLMIFLKENPCEFTIF